MRPWPELFLYRIDTTLVILPSTAFIASGHMRFPTSRRLAIHGVIPAHLIADGVVRGVGICDARACVYCLYLARRVSFSTRASAQSQTTANQRTAYFRLKVPVLRGRYRPSKAGTRFTKCLSKPGERARDENLTSAIGAHGIRTYIRLINIQVFYHWTTVLQVSDVQRCTTERQEIRALRKTKLNKS